MEMIALDTLGRLYHRGHGMFGWCLDCGSPAQYWDDVRAKRALSPLCSISIFRGSFVSVASNARSLASRPLPARGADRSTQSRGQRHQASRAVSSRRTAQAVAAEACRR
jgi:hypothetical protein